jgi:hypothetical protein
MILEDDITFLDPTLFQQQFKKFTHYVPNYDVVILAGNNVPPYRPMISPEDGKAFAIQVTHCQTTTGYLVKSHYYDKLIHNIKEGLHRLIVNPEQHVQFAVDKYWLSLQKTDAWYLITPLTVVQREDYSDIEQRRTNYTRAMVDLDKVEFLKMVSMSSTNIKNMKLM